MPDRLVTELLAALDRGHTVRLARPDHVSAVADGVDVTVEETLPDGRALVHRTLVTRDELLVGAGSITLGHAIEVGSVSITQAPRP